MSVTIEIVSGPDYQRDDDGWEHHAYTLRLHFEGRTMDIPWRQGLAITDDPNPEDVLENLSSDAVGFLNADGFEDWATEYGYDTDSRKAEATYRAVDEQTEALRDLLGEAFEQVVYAQRS